MTNALIEASDLTPKQEAFAIAYVEHGNAAHAYRTVYDVGADTLPSTVHRTAHELVRHPRVRVRIHELRNAIAERFEISAAALRMRQFEIATAPALQHVRVFNCRHCHGIDHGYQWRDASELAKAVDAHLKSVNSPKPTPLPDPRGGYGFDAFAKPSPDCDKCMGAGVSVLYTVDTTELSGAALAAYKGATVDRNGNVVIEQHDQQAAAFELHAMVPGALAPKQTESRSVSLHVEPLKDMSPDDVLAFMTRQKLIT
jgi:phage terminase small subunit